MPVLDNETIWTAVGFLGQALFGARFLVQWAVSERERRSVVPLAFWFLSIGGGMVMLTYAIWLESYPIILGQISGLAVYLRNLYFVYSERRKAAVAAD